ncbi:MAG: hypothetical protein A3K13_11705 [Gemmatimonadetes bacterium RIFCSPLOWO2_12_FULL_68_9]|nr:MAG: hypothetical protein A3K13_11705 [Gemmatimonadetes bacterium RIFCSPLOWO2_12_FULL_68_9]
MTIVIDYSNIFCMIEDLEIISISAFKATCLAVLERVRQTGRRVIVTKHGEPIAEVVPPSPASKAGDWLGAMRGRFRVTGDIVGPASDEEDWEALA